MKFIKNYCFFKKIYKKLVKVHKILHQIKRKLRKFQKTINFLQEFTKNKLQKI